MRLSKIFERPIRRHRLDFANPIQKLNPKKVLDGILGQCYMALTPCLVVGGKPLDVESSGFFFILIPSHRRMSVLGCPELPPFAPQLAIPRRTDSSTLGGRGNPM